MDTDVHVKLRNILQRMEPDSNDSSYNDRNYPQCEKVMRRWTASYFAAVLRFLDDIYSHQCEDEAICNNCMVSKDRRQTRNTQTEYTCLSNSEQKRPSPIEIATKIECSCKNVSDSGMESLLDDTDYKNNLLTERQESTGGYKRNVCPNVQLSSDALDSDDDHEEPEVQSAAARKENSKQNSRILSINEVSGKKVPLKNEPRRRKPNNLIKKEIEKKIQEITIKQSTKNNDKGKYEKYGFEIERKQNCFAVDKEGTEAQKEKPVDAEESNVRSKNNKRLHEEQCMSEEFCEDAIMNQQNMFMNSDSEKTSYDPPTIKNSGKLTEKALVEEIKENCEIKMSISNEEYLLLEKDDKKANYDFEDHAQETLKVTCEYDAKCPHQYEAVKSPTEECHTVPGASHADVNACNSVSEPATECELGIGDTNISYEEQQGNISDCSNQSKLLEPPDITSESDSENDKKVKNCLQIDKNAIVNEQNTFIKIQSGKTSNDLTEFEISEKPTEKTLVNEINENVNSGTKNKNFEDHTQDHTQETLLVTCESEAKILHQYEAVKSTSGECHTFPGDTHAEVNACITVSESAMEWETGIGDTNKYFEEQQGNKSDGNIELLAGLQDMPCESNPKSENDKKMKCKKVPSDQYMAETSSTNENVAFKTNAQDVNDLPSVLKEDHSTEDLKENPKNLTEKNACSSDDMLDCHRNFPHTKSHKLQESQDPKFKPVENPVVRQKEKDAFHSNEPFNHDRSMKQVMENDLKNLQLAKPSAKSAHRSITKGNERFANKNGSELPHMKLLTESASNKYLDVMDRTNISTKTNCLQIDKNDILNQQKKFMNSDSELTSYGLPAFENSVKPTEKTLVDDMNDNMKFKNKKSLSKKFSNGVNTLLEKDDKQTNDFEEQAQDTFTVTCESEVKSPHSYEAVKSTSEECQVVPGDTHAEVNAYISVSEPTTECELGVGVTSISFEEQQGNNSKYSNQSRMPELQDVSKSENDEMVICKDDQFLFRNDVQDFLSELSPKEILPTEELKMADVVSKADLNRASAITKGSGMFDNKIGCDIQNMKLLNEPASNKTLDKKDELLLERHSVRNACHGSVRDDLKGSELSLKELQYSEMNDTDMDFSGSLHSDMRHLSNEKVQGRDGTERVQELLETHTAEVRQRDTIKEQINTCPSVSTEIIVAAELAQKSNLKQTMTKKPKDGALQKASEECTAVLGRTDRRIGKNETSLVVPNETTEKQGINTELKEKLVRHGYRQVTDECNLYQRDNRQVKGSRTVIADSSQRNDSGDKKQSNCIEVHTQIGEDNIMYLNRDTFCDSVTFQSWPAQGIGLHEYAKTEQVLNNGLVEDRLLIKGKTVVLQVNSDGTLRFMVTLGERCNREGCRPLANKCLIGQAFLPGLHIHIEAEKVFLQIGKQNKILQSNCYGALSTHHPCLLSCPVRSPYCLKLTVNLSSNIEVHTDKIRSEPTMKPCTLHQGPDTFRNSPAKNNSTDMENADKMLACSVNGECRPDLSIQKYKLVRANVIMLANSELFCRFLKILGIVKIHVLREKTIICRFDDLNEVIFDFCRYSKSLSDVIRRLLNSQVHENNHVGTHDFSGIHIGYEFCYGC